MRNRLLLAAAALAAGCVFIAILTVALEPDGRAASVLLDRRSRAFPFPFTIQNATWLLFFVGLGELVGRWTTANGESRQILKGFLPEDERTLLQPGDLREIVKRLRADGHVEEFYLQRLLNRLILQFQAARSIDQANSLLNSSVELYQHEIDMKYNMLKYLVWLIPTLGFIGTIIGISLALNSAGEFPGIDLSAVIKKPGAVDPVRVWMQSMTNDLAVAFNTTFVALILSAILVFFLHVTQELEEMALNRGGQYCIDNFITRLYIK